jgi:hypothetical protein
MSETQPLPPEEIQVQRDILMQQAIDRQLSRLIQTGAKAVATLKPASGKTLMQESQFRNVLNVARETSSVDVVTNFIRYQIGRTPSVWGTQPTAFGPTLIRDIEDGAVVQAAQTVRDAVQAHLRTDADISGVFEDAYIRLTRLYLGYAMRVFYYGKRREDAGDPTAWDQLFREAKE